MHGKVQHGSCDMDMEAKLQVSPLVMALVSAWVAMCIEIPAAQNSCTVLNLIDVQ